MGIFVASANAQCPNTSLGINRDGFFTYVQTGYVRIQINAAANAPFEIPLSNLSPCALDIQMTSTQAFPIATPAQVVLKIQSIKEGPNVSAVVVSNVAFHDEVQFAYTTYITTKENMQAAASIRDSQPVCKGTIPVSGGLAGCAESGAQPIRKEIVLAEEKCWFAVSPSITTSSHTSVGTGDHIDIIETVVTPDRIKLAYNVGGLHTGEICALSSIDWTATAKSKFPFPAKP